MFPNLVGKKFIDISNNESVLVKDQFENIAILNNNQRTDVKRLLDRSFYEESIDPQKFFDESNLHIFAEKIKSIPNESLQNIKDDDSLIIQYDPEEEKRILEQKARNFNLNTFDATKNQLEKFKELLADDEEDFQIQHVNRDINVSSSIISNTQQIPVRNDISVVDPMISMFKNIKKNTDFKISIDIINKIPRPDFIEMMEDSYEISIIDYLSKEFTNSLLNDPSFIEDKIREEIRNIVYSKKKVTKIPVKEKTISPPKPPTNRIVKEGKSPKKPTSVENKIEN